MATLFHAIGADSPSSHTPMITSNICAPRLAASVWTGNVKTAMQVASRLQYGCVWVNQHFTLVNEMPHGGRQMSGYGTDMSVYGLEDYTVVRHVMVNFG